jgi:hypothetical protein
MQLWLSLQDVSTGRRGKAVSASVRPSRIFPSSAAFMDHEAKKEDVDVARTVSRPVSDQRFLTRHPDPTAWHHVAVGYHGTARSKTGLLLMQFSAAVCRAGLQSLGCRCWPTCHPLNWLRILSFSKNAVSAPAGTQGSPTTSHRDDQREREREKFTEVCSLDRSSPPPGTKAA